jgi:hypothetical protein
VNLTGRAAEALKNFALGAGIGLAVLAVALAGLGFFITAFYIWLARHFDAATAAAMTGATLVLLAILIAITGADILRRLKKPQPGLLSDFGGTLGLGLRLAGILVRRDPKKAIIIAAVTGALAEFIMSDRKDKQ